MRLKKILLTVFAAMLGLYATASDPAYMIVENTSGETKAIEVTTITGVSLNDGTVIVSLTDGGGVKFDGKNVKRITFGDAAGVGTLEANSSVGFYPNPVIDNVTIVGADADASVKLYSVTGAQVLAAKGCTQLDLSSVSQGTYVLIIDGKPFKLIKK